MPRKEIIESIENERKRQIMTEGYFPKDDDLLVNGELALAASVYAQPEDNRHLEDWPFGEKRYHPVPTSRKTELIKAAALIIAELERIERLSGIK